MLHISLQGRLPLLDLHILWMRGFLPLSQRDHKLSICPMQTRDLKTGITTPRGAHALTHSRHIKHKGQQATICAALKVQEQARWVFYEGAEQIPSHGKQSVCRLTCEESGGVKGGEEVERKKKGGWVPFNEPPGLALVFFWETLETMLHMGIGGVMASRLRVGRGSRCAPRPWCVSLSLDGIKGCQDAEPGWLIWNVSGGFFGRRKTSASTPAVPGPLLSSRRSGAHAPNTEHRSFL